MKRFIITALACMSVVAVAAAPSLAGNGPAKKVNGDIWFQNTSYEQYGIPNPEGLAHWVFNGQEGSPAKGSMTYTDGYGSYTAKVIDVKVLNAEDAEMTVQITSATTPYAQVGVEVTFTLHDMGEPGVGFDYFTAPGLDGDVDLPTITAGNIQVHNK